MCNSDFNNGIIVAFIGGTIGGIVIWLIGLIQNYILNHCHTKRLEKWLETSNFEWNSTRAIASHNNLTEDRVRFLCSYSKNIQLNTKDGNESNEVWKLRDND